MPGTRLEGPDGTQAERAGLSFVRHSSPLFEKLRADLARLGRALRWHGALSVDAIVVEGRAFIIDVNPRLVEPGNALAAGTDLVSALLAVTLGAPAVVTPPVTKSPSACRGDATRRAPKREAS